MTPSHLECGLRLGAVLLFLSRPGGGLPGGVTGSFKELGPALTSFTPASPGESSSTSSFSGDLFLRLDLAGLFRLMGLLPGLRLFLDLFLALRGEDDGLRRFAFLSLFEDDALSFEGSLVLSSGSLWRFPWTCSALSLSGGSGGAPFPVAPGGPLRSPRFSSLSLLLFFSFEGEPGTVSLLKSAISWTSECHTRSRRSRSSPPSAGNPDPRTNPTILSRLLQMIQASSPSSPLAHFLQWGQATRGICWKAKSLSQNGYGIYISHPMFVSPVDFPVLDN